MTKLGIVVDIYIQMRRADRIVAAAGKIGLTDYAMEAREISQDLNRWVQQLSSPHESVVRGIASTLPISAAKLDELER